MAKPISDRMRRLNPTQSSWPKAGELSTCSPSTATLSTSGPSDRVFRARRRHGCERYTLAARIETVSARQARDRSSTIQSLRYHSSLSLTRLHLLERGLPAAHAAEALFVGEVREKSFSTLPSYPSMTVSIAAPGCGRMLRLNAQTAQNLKLVVATTARIDCAVPVSRINC